MILGLESSGRSGSAALGFPLGDIVSCFTTPGEGSARTLAPAVSKLLRQSSVRPTDLLAVAVTVGPGSFTGLRVGVAMAKAMAYGLRIPTVGVDTLEVLATDFQNWLLHRGQSQRSEFWTVLDAYRGEFFVAKWLISPNSVVGFGEAIGATTPELSCLIPSQIVPHKTWLEWAATESPGTKVVGSGVSKLLGVANADLPELVGFANFVPTAASVVRIATRMFGDGQVTSPLELMPVYLRGSAAEEKISSGKPK